MDIIKKDDTTYIEVVPEKKIESFQVEGTLDTLLADIEGTQTWLDKAKAEVVAAQAQLDMFLNKKQEVIDLGIVTKAEAKEDAPLDVPIDIIP